MYNDEEVEVKNESIYDTDEFSELVLKHLVRDKEVYRKAQSQSFRPDDLVASEKGGTKIYKILAKIVFEINDTPVDRQVLEMHITSKKDEPIFKTIEPEQIKELLDWVYDGDLSPEYISLNLLSFSRRRRFNKVVLKEGTDNPTKLLEELSKVHIDICAVEVKQSVVSLSPFETMVKKTTRNGIRLGFPKIDDTTGGLGKGECGLIVGHSGTGKTAFTTYIARMAAIGGHNVLYISAEEPAENVVCRWYAQQFDLSYTKLYKGEAEWEKEQAFRGLSADTREQLSRLRVSDVRNLHPLNAETIFELIEQKAKEGFIAELVVIDQLDYVRTKIPMGKNTQKWQMYELTSFELDEMSHKLILGEHGFALWVIHQGAGEMSWSYTYDGIAGFKGIVKPFDLAIGLGREDRFATHLNAFSLKVRHSEHFQLPLASDFDKMSFRPDENYKTKDDRDKADKKTQKRGLGRPRKNPIPDASKTAEAEEE